MIFGFATGNLTAAAVHPEAATPLIYASNDSNILLKLEFSSEKNSHFTSTSIKENDCRVLTDRSKDECRDWQRTEKWWKWQSRRRLRSNRKERYMTCICVENSNRVKKDKKKKKNSQVGLNPHYPRQTIDKKIGRTIRKWDPRRKSITRHFGFGNPSDDGERSKQSQNSVKVSSNPCHELSKEDDTWASLDACGFEHTKPCSHR